MSKTPVPAPPMTMAQLRKRLDEALANGHQAAHDVTDHVVQKGIALKLEAPVSAVPGNADVSERLDR